MTALDPGTRVSPIGARVLNVDWQPKTSGAAEYSGDLHLPGMLYARVLRSPLPHARIRSIDTAEALRAEGVVGVVTAADLPDRTYIHHGGPLADRRVMARDVVRFVGEEVAGVAAESLAAADRALSLIAVDYQRLPAATTIAEALAPGAPKIHPGGNVSVRSRRDWGAAADDRTEAAFVHGTYRFGRQTHACMETNSIVARWDAEAKVLEIWASTQAPFIVRKEIANVLDLDLDSVVLHEIAVGGGFGAKSKICEYEAIAAALSMRTGRPVRLVLTREEEFSTTKSRHGFEIELRTAATAEGLLCSRDAKLKVDNGAYNHSGPSVMANGTQVIGSLYRVPHVTIDAELIYTNKHPGGQFRGYGAPQVVFAIESQTDELAEALGIDPIDFRIMNANRAGDVTLTGWRIDSARLVECLERARAEIDWDRKRSLRGSGRGVGLAAAIHVSGANIYDGANRSAAGIDISADGRIRVRFGGSDAGTWQKTLLAQFAAAELGVDPEGIDLLTMESHLTPHELGAWSSRGTFMSGHAVGAAARSAAARLRTHAATLLGVTAPDIELHSGSAWAGSASVTFADIVNQCENGLLTIEEEVVIDVDQVNRETGVANISGAYSFAVQAVEVEVDPVTGRVRVIDAVSIHDSGVAINPIGFESQVVGGMAMGIGLALGEELLYEEGRSMTRSYINYPLPRANDLPRMRTVLIHDVDPHGPHGAKGVGEIVLVPTGAAVANAIAHATGIRLHELPATPDRMLAAMRASAPKRDFRIRVRPGRWWIEGMRRAYPLGVHRLLHRWGTRFARPLRRREITQIVRPIDAAGVSAGLQQSGAQIIAGGTDLLPARRQGVAAPAVLIDISTVTTLAGPSREGDAIDIPAATRLTDLADWARTEPGVEILAEVIDQIANPQIREMATVGGNLCQQNRCWFLRNDFMCYKRGGASCPCYAVQGDHRFYHAVIDGHRCQSVTPSDLATAFVALDATARIRGASGTRDVPMASFFTGPGETILRSGEFLERVLLTARPRAGMAYEKLNRGSGDFAIVSVAAVVEVDDEGAVRDARVVLGAVAPVPFRATDTERALVQGGAAAATDAAEAWTSHAHPLAGNGWKVDAAVGMVERSISHALLRAGGTR